MSLLKHNERSLSIMSADIDPYNNILFREQNVFDNLSSLYISKTL